MNKFKAELKGTDLVASYDGDADGVNSAEFRAHLAEVYTELFAKGEAKVQGSLNYKREGGKLTITFDSDKDGKPSVSFMIDLVEGLKEAIK